RGEVPARRRERRRPWPAAQGYRHEQFRTAPRLDLHADVRSEDRAARRLGLFLLRGEQRRPNAHSNPLMNVIQAFVYDQNDAPGLRLSDGIPLPVQPNLADPKQLDGIYTAFDPS